MSEQQMSSMGERIREARKAAGLSQQELGRRMYPPRTHATISDMERGISQPSVRDIVQLSQILNVHVLYFLPEASGDPPIVNEMRLREEITRLRDENARLTIAVWQGAAQLERAGFTVRALDQQVKEIEAENARLRELITGVRP